MTTRVALVAVSDQPLEVAAHEAYVALCLKQSLVPPPRQAPPQRAPAVQPARPASPGGESGRPADRDARPPAQPRAQPLHEALELERK